MESVFKSADVAGFIQRTSVDFLRKDLVAEFQQLGAGAVATVRRLGKLAIATKEFCQSDRKQQSAKDFTRATSKIPKNVVNAVRFMGSEVQRELNQMTAEEKRKFLLRLAAYTACFGGSAYAGNQLPDKDITYLGIGGHRNLMFHSVLVGVGVRLSLRLIERILVSLEEEGAISTSQESDFFKSCLLISRSGVSIGIAAHLAWDGTVQGTKAVLLSQDLGSAIPGTLADDNAWLLLNSFVSILLGKADFKTFQDGDLTAQELSVC